jgi:negative regulator of sigma-B (phosphoserine phosphatase)
VRSVAGVADRTVAEKMEWAVATRCRRGEATTGDLAVLSLLPEGALVAAIDGVGHGDEAARAALKAGEVVRRQPSQDLVLLAHHCHTALRHTRGAAITLAFISSSKGAMTWLGVGNVEGRVLSGDPSSRGPKASLALGAGIAGHELPRVRTTTLDLRAGDVVVLATDGVRDAFGDSLDVSGSTQAIADRILADHWRPADDALVVALRYLGARP